MTRTNNSQVSDRKPAMNLFIESNFITSKRAVYLLLIISLTSTCLLINEANGADSPASSVISSRAAFLRAQRASRQSPSAAPQRPENIGASTNSTSANSSATTTTSTSTSTTTTTTTTTTSTTSKPKLAISPAAKRDSDSSARVQPAPVATNRTIRTADVFQNGEGYNIFVTNTCGRDTMYVNIKTSRAFYGVIHTRNERSKSVCTVEGNGDTDYNLSISQVLNPADPNYCGVIKARRDSPEDKDLLSVVLAVRVHRKIELPDDKFFLLNCTNRCRFQDCSRDGPANNKLSAAPSDMTRGRVVAGEIPESGERESVTTPASGSADANSNNVNEGECTIYKFPWVITLLWCMGILLLALIISHCIMCSSLVCRCVKTEVEEREPSVYEDDDSDDEDNLYNKKNHPMRIDYDNRDIYKTSYNYEPYSLDEAQAKNRSRTKGFKSSSRR